MNHSALLECFTSSANFLFSFCRYRLVAFDEASSKRAKRSPGYFVIEPAAVSVVIEPAAVSVVAS